MSVLLSIGAAFPAPGYIHERHVSQRLGAFPPLQYPHTSQLAIRSPAPAVPVPGI